jgi:hypothetical protein
MKKQEKQAEKIAEQTAEKTAELQSNSVLHSEAEKTLLINEEDLKILNEVLTDYK